MTIIEEKESFSWAPLPKWVLFPRYSFSIMLSPYGFFIFTPGDFQHACMSREQAKMPDPLFHLEGVPSSTLSVFQLGSLFQLYLWVSLKKLSLSLSSQCKQWFVFFFTWLENSAHQKVPSAFLWEQCTVIVWREEAFLKIPMENAKAKNKVQRNLVRINGIAFWFKRKEDNKPASFEIEKKGAKQKPHRKKLTNNKWEWPLPN